MQLGVALGLGLGLGLESDSNPDPAPNPDPDQVNYELIAQLVEWLLASSTTVRGFGLGLG